MNKKQTRNSIIIEAINSGDYETAIEMIDNYSVANDILHKSNILRSSFQNVSDIQIMETILSLKANPNEYGEDGLTPFHSIAISAKNPQIIKVFSENGGNINIPCKKYNMTPLFFACVNNNFEIVKAFIDCGANIKALDKELNNALFYAVWNQYYAVDIIKLLSESGIDILHINKKQESALHYAVKLNVSHVVVKELLKLGADASHIDRCSFEPIYWTARHGNLASMKAFVDFSGFPGPEALETLFNLLLASVESNIITSSITGSKTLQ